MTDQNELAKEFAENGLYELGEITRDDGIEAARAWIEGAITEAREDDRLYHHGEGWELHNPEVARDMLNAETP